MRVGILTLRGKYSRRSTNFYPLIKWSKEFLEQEGVKFKFYTSHEEKGLLNEDVVLIDSRYCRKVTVLDKQYGDLNFIKEFINKLKQKTIKVILFDNSDSAGGRYFELIEYVDLHVKKQLLKNRAKYTEDNGVYSYRVYLEEYYLSKETRDRNENEDYDYEPCPPDQLHKVKLGWNIGLGDFRYFPFKRYYPTDELLNGLYKSPRFYTELRQKPYASSFRGTINREDENYSFQRNEVLKLFNKLNSQKYITGGKLGKRNYLTELKKSKVCVSPFGWGEVCFRDFEGIICGCLLLKPDMSHIETYPNIYEINKTYVPLSWDMSNLEEKLQFIVDNYEDYLGIIREAQSIYKDAILNFAEFRNRFISIVS